MPYIRKLPSGKWSAVIRGADGHRHSNTFALKKLATDWAAEEEAKARHGIISDPKLARTSVEDWYQQWTRSRSIDISTAKGADSWWRNHVRPRWGSWEIGAIRRIDVATWVREMEAAKIGAATITKAYHLLSGMMRAAALETPPLIQQSPCHDIPLPRAPRKRAKVFTPGQIDRILAALPARHRPMIELDSYAGLRWGELAGIHADQVDWRDTDRPDTSTTIVIHRVLTRYGIREWPKNDESNRVIPVPGHLSDDLWKLAADRPEGAPLFVGARGALLDDVKFRNRIWYPAVAVAGACPEHRGRSRVRPEDHHRLLVECSACEPVPWWPPRVLRHTAASLLLRAGVPREQVQALLGHSSETTTEIYAQFDPGSLPDVRRAWADRDPRATHGPAGGAEGRPAESGGS